VRWSGLDDERWTAAFKPQGNRTVSTVVSSELPQRLADALIARAGVEPRTTLATLTRADRLRLIGTLVRGELPWTGPSAAEGYKKAEVTGGGVSLAEIDPRTLESRRAARLFLCGEILDAFGPIGGYNFFWAWATGRAAGLAAASLL
jgi:predicted flavoprotein YhiN